MTRVAGDWARVRTPFGPAAVTCPFRVERCRCWSSLSRSSRPTQMDKGRGPGKLALLSAQVWSSCRDRQQQQRHSSLLGYLVLAQWSAGPAGPGMHRTMRGSTISCSLVRRSESWEPGYVAGGSTAAAGDRARAAVGPPCSASGPAEARLSDANALGPGWRAHGVTARRRSLRLAGGLARLVTRSALT